MRVLGGQKWRLTREGEIQNHTIINPAANPHPYIVFCTAEVIKTHLLIPLHRHYTATRPQQIATYLTVI